MENCNYIFMSKILC